MIRATWRHRGHIPAGRVDRGISRQRVGHGKGGVVVAVGQRASLAVHKDLSTHGMDYSRGGPEALLCLGPRRQRPVLSGASAVSSVRAVCGVSTLKERTGKSVLRRRNITLQDSGIRAPHSLLYAKVGVTGILQQKTLTGHTPVDVTGILLQKNLTGHTLVGVTSILQQKTLTGHTLVGVTSILQQKTLTDHTSVGVTGIL